MRSKVPYAAVPHSGTQRTFAHAYKHDSSRRRQDGGSRCVENIFLAERAVVAISSTMGERVRGGKSASALTVRLLKLFVLGEVGSRTSC